MRSRRFQIGAALIVILSGSVAANGGNNRVDRLQEKASGDGQPITNDPLRSDSHAAGPRSQLKIVNIRLEPAPPTEGSPASILKFDLLNEGSVRQTDLKLEISITEKPGPDHEPAPRRLVGPFTIQGHIVLQGGYTIRYEMLLQNFSSDCSCIADVDVVSVRPLPSTSTCHSSSSVSDELGDC
jgi:hypothetical protein